MEITDREEIAQALAESYCGRRYTDPWDRIQEYKRVIAYAAEHPNKGSAAVASALELPRSRIRPWMENDARPDPVRAIQVAEEYGWLDLEYRTQPFEALNILVAWIFASGSLEQQYSVPLFHVTGETQMLLESVLNAANAPPHRIERKNDDRRAMELHITDHHTVFGRLLEILGAPVGTKNADSTSTLPPYLSAAPEESQLRFARTYLWLRGTPRPDRENRPVQIQEQRSQQYYRELRAFLNSLSRDAVCGNTWPLSLTRDAARELYRPPQTT